MTLFVFLLCEQSQVDHLRDSTHLGHMVNQVCIDYYMRLVLQSNLATVSVAPKHISEEHDPLPKINNLAFGHCHHNTTYATFSLEYIGVVCNS